MAFDYGVELERSPENLLEHVELHAPISTLVSTEEFMSIYRFTAEQVAEKKDIAFVLAYLSLRDKQFPMTGNLSEFMRASRAVFGIFGEHAFRKWRPVSSRPKSLALNPGLKSSWGRKVSPALSLSLVVAASHFPSDQLAIHAEAIREKVLNLMSSDLAFIYSLRGKGKSPGKMAMRIGMLKERISDCINKPDANLYPHKIKQMLYEASAMCVVCKKLVTHIDDGHVSPKHFVDGWMVGSEPVINLGLLSHRLCNLMVMRGFIHPAGSIFHQAKDSSA